MTTICQIFKSSRKAEMYLYVEKERGLEDVPEALLGEFGEPQEVMVLPLTAQRKLARVNAAEVLAAIAQQGYYLQLPPTPAALLRRDRASD